jgi:hypothetical protein
VQYIPFSNTDVIPRIMHQPSLYSIVKEHGQGQSRLRFSLAQYPVVPPNQPKVSISAIKHQN